MASLRPTLAPASQADGFPFGAHVELVSAFIADRNGIVESIQRLLNAQRETPASGQDTSLLGRQFEDCFFTRPGISPAQAGLHGQLDEAHWEDGFQPRDIPGLHNSIVDPVELLVRGVHLWQQTQWPGRNGRVRYAHTLFHLYVIRSLALLSLRLWDAGADGPGDRLSQVQHLLDTLWASAPPNHPVLVRDARWLIQLAQSAATDELAGYFEVIRRVVETLPREDRLAVHRAGVRMAGGHLRSQLHYYSRKRGVSLDDQSLVSNARTTNALDFALLIQDLVPLLEAYEEACGREDQTTRLELADAIVQGLSPDPELFLNRLDLLGPYSMIDYLFIRGDGPDGAAYTLMGRRHMEMIREYETRIARLCGPLYEDCASFRPVPGRYSPFGILYGFTTDLVEHMALKTIQPEAVTTFSLEDVFVAGDTDKLEWVNGWRKLPHVTREVQKQFEYPHTFAEETFARVEAALRGQLEGASHATGRLFVVPGEHSLVDSQASAIPDLPLQYIQSSDPSLVAAKKARVQDVPQLSSDRREGRCILFYTTPGGSVVISKGVLTEVLGAGRDARLSGLPSEAAAVLKSMCPNLVVLPEGLTPGPPAV